MIEINIVTEEINSEVIELTNEQQVALCKCMIDHGYGER